MRSTAVVLGLALAPLLVGACSQADSGATTAAPAAGGAPSSGGAGGAGGGGGGGTGGAAAHGGAGGARSGRLLDGDCDPLVPTQCGFPFPSSAWLEEGAPTATGRRVAFGATTLPARKSNGKHTSPAPWLGSDGFSPGATIMTHLPGATVDGLPTQHTIEASIAKGSPTVVLDVATGELVPHFAELDSSARTDDARAFLIRPVVRLRDDARYVVAIRGVKGGDAKALAPTPAFAALRDGTPSSEPSVERRRALYDEIFGALAKAGVPKDDLQLAWDFRTASRANNTSWLLHMRDEALATVGDEGPEYTIEADKTIENPNPHIRRRIFGMMKVPLYLDAKGPSGKLVLGADGLPKQNGFAEYEFEVNVPNSATKGAPVPLLQNGHGLLGDKGEGDDGYLAELCDTKGFVGFSVDFVGFAAEDETPLGFVLLGDIGNFRHVVERQHQGMLNSLLAMRMMKGRFWKDPLVTFDGVSAIDPTRRYYRGDSQGGIMGATYVALSTDVTRGLLGEPGFPYQLLLNRSVDFQPFFDQLRGVYDRDLDIQLLLGLVQMLWDRVEPDGWAPYVRDPLPGTPKHEVLLQVAIGDHQVTPLGAHLLARTLGAKNLAPANRDVWGLEAAGAPIASGSAMIEYSFGLPASPDTNTPPVGPAYPDSDDPHDKVRKLSVSHDVTSKFLRDGEVDAFCSGPCDPE
jgi:hypothetical protein